MHDTRSLECIDRFTVRLVNIDEPSDTDEGLLHPNHGSICKTIDAPWFLFDLEFYFFSLDVLSFEFNRCPFWQNFLSDRRALVV